MLQAYFFRSYGMYIFKKYLRKSEQFAVIKINSTIHIFFRLYGIYNCKVPKKNQNSTYNRTSMYNRNLRVFMETPIKGPLQCQGKTKVICY